jgi:hypothetical protein
MERLLLMPLSDLLKLVRTKSDVNNMREPQRLYFLLTLPSQNVIENNQETWIENQIFSENSIHCY